MKIHTVAQGKTIDQILTDGKDLIIRTTDSQEIVIGFDKGPYLKGVNVRIVMPMPAASISAAG